MFGSPGKALKVCKEKPAKAPAEHNSELIVDPQSVAS
jgi:hypothetical protein